MARSQQTPDAAPDKGEGKTDAPKADAPKKDAAPDKGEGGLAPGSVRVRTEHPKRFGHVACHGLVFNPEPRVFAPGELSEDALARLKLDQLLVVEEG